MATPGLSVPGGLQAVPTNMVFVQVDASLGTAADLAARLADQGVLALPLDPQRLRLVTHMDVDTAGVERACQALTRCAIPIAS